MTLLGKFLARRRRARRALRWLPQVDYLVMLNRRGYISADAVVRGVRKGVDYVLSGKQ